MKDVPSIADTATPSMTPNHTRTLRSPTCINNGFTPFNFNACLEADVRRIFFIVWIFLIYSVGRADLSTKIGHEPVSNRNFIGEWSFIFVPHVMRTL